jgi:hypothetical protein
MAGGVDAAAFAPDPRWNFGLQKAQNRSAWKIYAAVTGRGLGLFCFHPGGGG